MVTITRTITITQEVVEQVNVNRDDLPIFESNSLSVIPLGLYDREGNKLDHAAYQGMVELHTPTGRYLAEYAYDTKMKSHTNTHKGKFV